MAHSTGGIVVKAPLGVDVIGTATVWTAVSGTISFKSRILARMSSFLAAMKSSKRSSFQRAGSVGIRCLVKYQIEHGGPPVRNFSFE